MIINFLNQESITSFLKELGLSAWELCPLSGDGSARRFLRVKCQGKSFVLIVPQEGEFGLREAASYVGIGRYLRSQGLPVPEILAHDPKTGFILVEDLGNMRLEDLPPAERRPFYQQVLEILVAFQQAGKGFDTSLCLETVCYDQNLMWEREACYFMEAFLTKHLGLLPTPELRRELQELVAQAAQSFTDRVLLHRDFQSRNIMICQGKPFLIDFQGARLGPPAYDLASLLIDPYVALSKWEREELFRNYLALTGREEGAFQKEFYFLSVMRNLQILGAFARLSALGKRWFASYLPQAFTNLRAFIEEHFSDLLALRRVLAQTAVLLEL